jgi:type IV pilus assembly protein PilC
LDDGPFDVRATDADGNASYSRVEAESVESLVEHLAADGLQVSEVTGSGTRRLFEPRRFSAEDFAAFNVELAAACRRNVPLPGALRVLSKELRSAAVRDSLEAVARDVEGGADLASAFARRSEVFPPGYVALVDAGIKSGDLAGTLLVFAEEARFSARMRDSLRSAVLYPLLVVFAATLFLSFAGCVLLPEFEKTFDDMLDGRVVPPLTRLVFAAAPVLGWAPVVFAGACVLAVAAWRFLLRGSTRARLVAEVVMAIPAVGSYIHAVALTRFCRTLSNALSAEVPVPEAVALAGLASGNAAVQSAAAELQRKVAEGGAISEGLEEEGDVFPATFVWMLSLSESRGEVRPALDEYAKLQEERARRLGDVLPVLTATVVGVLGAALLGASVIAVFQPLIALMESIR